jgi:hypothetical protein
MGAGDITGLATKAKARLWSCSGKSLDKRAGETGLLAKSMLKDFIRTKRFFRSLVALALARLVTCTEDEEGGI